MSNTEALALLGGVIAGSLFSPIILHVIDGNGDLCYKWVTVPLRRRKEEYEQRARELTDEFISYKEYNEWLVKKNDIEVAGMLAFLNEAVERDKAQGVGPIFVDVKGPRQSIDVNTDEGNISTKS